MDRIILLSMDSLILVWFEFYWLSLDNLDLVWLGLLVGFGLFLLCLVGINFVLFMHNFHFGSTFIVTLLRKRERGVLDSFISFTGAPTYLD